MKLGELMRRLREARMYGFIVGDDVCVRINDQYYSITAVKVRRDLGVILEAARDK